MKCYYTPVLCVAVSAASLFLTSLNVHAEPTSGPMVLASLNTNTARTSKPVAPSPQALHAASLRGDLMAVQRLVKEHVNIHYANSDKETALHMAASRGHLAVVVFLLKNKANINARTQNNWIPLHHAVRFNRPRVANYLMAKGAPPHFKTGDGLNSFDIAVNMGNVKMINMVQGYINRR